MSGKFNIDGYVDVAERIAQFIEKYPEGSLQSTLTPIEQDGKLVGWLCRAEAYRTADDPRPGVGHAVEPVPGKTPYTKDSEAMNSETSAWGRAIIALGFETKKIASQQEVRNRQGAGQTATAPPAGITEKQLAEIAELVPALATMRGVTVEEANKAIGDVASMSEKDAGALVAKLRRAKKNLEESAGEPRAAEAGSDAEGTGATAASSPAEQSAFKIPEKARAA